MTTDTAAAVPDAEWAEEGRAWPTMTRAERAALHPRFANVIRAEWQAYQERRERKNRASERRRWLSAEIEAWSEYAERERAARLRRAVRRVRVAQ